MFVRVLYLVGQLAVAAVASIVLWYSSRSRPPAGVLPGLVLLVVLWNIAKAAINLIRYIRAPFQKRQEYFVTGAPLQEFVIEPIILDGPCMLLFKCDVPDTGVKFFFSEAGEAGAFVYAQYSRVGVDFKVGAGRATFQLKVKLPKYNAKSFKVTLTRLFSQISAKLTIEIRGHAKSIELPEHAQTMVRAFPVVPLPPA